MASSAQPPADVEDFANRYYKELNRAIGNRMRLIGVPEDLIGFKWPGIDDGPFVRYPTAQIGGNINPHLFPGLQAAINLDYGVLDADHPAMSEVPSWATSGLCDRVNAAIAHEYTEALAQPLPGLDCHQQAIRLAPETPLKISACARQILRAYRTVMGLGSEEAL
jgi:hypothetical protein